jgi:DNA-binding CsgD family transcriptional regulator
MTSRCRLCSYVDTHQDQIDAAVERLAVLSPREREVFDLLGAGISTTEMARELGLHASTIKSHIKSILAKLRLNRRTAGIVSLGLHLGNCPIRTLSSKQNSELTRIYED